MIPEGSEYALLDKNDKVVKSNIDKEKIDRVISYVKSVDKVDNGIGNKEYLYQIDRKDGYLVLKYTLESRYNSDKLNDVLPNPESLLLGIGIIAEMITIIVVAIYYANKLGKNLMPLVTATEKIKENNLDFDIERSKVKEFNKVLDTLGDLKVELKNSLEEQWRVEESKKEQVSSLAHDIKTPITIIRGNSELLLESDLEEDQEMYLKFILMNADKIELYLQKLMRCLNTVQNMSLISKT